MASAAGIASPPVDVVAANVAAALAEDLGSGDVTAALLPDGPDVAYLLCKEDAVICGRPWFDACHRALDPQVRIDWRVQEGDRVAKGAVLATLTGRSRALVSAERASLNFLQTLSGTATIAAQYVDAVRGTGAKILDTRKTIPGLRIAQKYAVPGQSPKPISPAAMDVLMRYAWPGNVRELENAIERACVTSRTESIEPENLPPELVKPAKVTQAQPIDLSRSLAD